MLKAGHPLAPVTLIPPNYYAGRQVRWARPVGRLSYGVLVGPVQSVTGLAFDRMYIVGMTESALPTPSPADPFFPSVDEDPLQSRQRHRRTDRLAFSTAVAAADGGRVTLSAPDSIDSRKAFPSPWLLDLAAQPSGIQPLFTTRFQSLERSAESGWLRVVTSAINGPSVGVLQSDGALLEGAIDLLYQHPDHTYARATRTRVSSIEFVFAALGGRTIRL